MTTLNTLFYSDGVHFVLRWLHTFAGVLWIGLLYYINFVQGGFMNDIDASMKSIAQQKLFPRVMLWFRYAALWTMVLGIVLLVLKYIQYGSDPHLDSYWLNILTGATMGLIMGSNVWFVIWPAQRRVIESAVQMATSGTKPGPEVAAGAARALVASRTNVLLSIPMLFFMNAASHWVYSAGWSGGTKTYFFIAALILALIEINALKGKTGPLTTVKGVITSGFILTLVFILLIAMFAGPTSSPSVY